MMKIIPLTLIAASLFCSSCSKQDLMASESKQDKVISVEESDAEMNKAIQNAHSTLVDFEKKFKTPGKDESNFSLKVKFEDENGAEHFWVTELTNSNGSYSGLIANDPRIVKSVKFGEKVKVRKADITDWSYDKNGVRQGSYTLKVLLNRMPEEQASYYRKQVGW